MNRPAFVPRDFTGKCKIFPKRDVMLLPFQERWVKDGSRLKLCVKARQIGFSWCTAYRTVRTLAADDARLDSWISSRDEISARLFLEDCKKFADLLSIAATDLGLDIIDESGNTAFTLRFANGTRAFSLSSNADAQAGKRGSRILDEFALHPDPRKLYQIAYPGTTWGGTLEIFSTTAAHGISLTSSPAKSSSATIQRASVSTRSLWKTHWLKVCSTSCNPNSPRMIPGSK